MYDRHSRRTAPHPASPDRRERVKRASSGASAGSRQNDGNPAFSNPTERLDLVALTNLMVGYRLDATFHALADPTRRAMLARLAGGEKSVTELTRGFAMSDAGATKHLAVLETAELVRTRREGRCRRCTLDADPLAEAALWLRRWQRFESPRAARLRAMLVAAERRG